jgi:drug/metabolite transporter (DMT)-like permease
MPLHQSRLIWLLILAVLVWGIYHAVGAYLLNHNPYRALMVMLCVVGYLAFWMFLLRRRQSRLERR